MQPTQKKKNMPTSTMAASQSRTQNFVADMGKTHKVFVRWTFSTVVKPTFFSSCTSSFKAYTASTRLLKDVVQLAKSIFIFACSLNKDVYPINVVKMVPLLLCEDSWVNRLRRMIIILSPITENSRFSTQITKQLCLTLLLQQAGERLVCKGVITHTSPQ